MDGYLGKEHEDILFEMNNFEKVKKIERMKRLAKKAIIGGYVAVSIGTIFGLLNANTELKSEIKQVEKEYDITITALNDLTAEYEEVMNSVSNINKVVENVVTVNAYNNNMHVFDDWQTGDEVTTYKGVEIPWYLKLVNYENPINDDFKVELKDLNNVYIFDKRASDALDQMMSDAKKCGLNPIICSSYRSLEKQSTLFYDYLYELISEGYEYEEAFKIAKKTNATPGNSEHHLGLAVDIISEEYGILDQGLENTLEYKWLEANCARYGFILRYPKGKYQETGIDYEPWHFRYVGESVARYITENNITLEEYLDTYIQSVD